MKRSCAVFKALKSEIDMDMATVLERINSLKQKIKENIFSNSNTYGLLK